MPATLEYSPYEATEHITESEVLDKYRNILVSDPDAIVVLEDLNCGHWQIKTYKSEAEKQRFYRNRLSDLYNNLMRGMFHGRLRR